MAKARTRTKNNTFRPLTEKTVRVEVMPLNFKVPSDFRREFKTYAARHDKKLNQLLYEAFAALKAKNND
jgi:hypothetical protein